MIIINNIIKEDKTKNQKKYSNAELASSDSKQENSDDLEKKLENILTKINGVGKVSVLVTYSRKQ